MMGAFRLFAGALLLFTPATQGSLHKDQELGFQINSPKDWKKIPIAQGEQWIVAKYVSNRQYDAKKDVKGMIARHTPEMKVILFPASIVKNREGSTPSEVKEGDGVVKLKNPYKDFKDYLKDNSYGGYFIAKEEETKINGIPATCLELKFEKGLLAPLHGIAWVFHHEEADWAVQFEVLEDHWGKLAPDFQSSLKSFKIIPRIGSLTAGRDSAKVDVDLNIFMRTWKKVSPEERAKKRAEFYDREMKTVLDRLPEDWKQKKSKNCFAVSHSDDNFTQRLLDQAEGIRVWLEQNFSFVGDGKPGPVTQAMQQAYFSLVRGEDPKHREWLAYV